MGTARYQNGQQVVAAAVRTFSADTSASRTWRLDCRSWNIRGAFICIVLDGRVFLVSRYFHGAGEARFHGLLLCHEVASDLLYIWMIDQSFDSCILTFRTHRLIFLMFYNSTVYSCHVTTTDRVGQGLKNHTRRHRRSIRPKSSTGSQFEWR